MLTKTASLSAPRGAAIEPQESISFPVDSRVERECTEYSKTGLFLDSLSTASRNHGNRHPVPQKAALGGCPAFCCLQDCPVSSSNLLKYVSLLISLLLYSRLMSPGNWAGATPLLHSFFLLGKKVIPVELTLFGKQIES